MARPPLVVALFLLSLACAPTEPGGPPVQPGTGSATGCMAGDLLAALGKDRLLMGVAATPGSEGDPVAAAAPFTSRYAYLAAGLNDGTGPCARCDASCGNAGAWWGCWQDTSQLPGAYVRDLVAKAKAAGQLPHVTYYELLHTSGVQEGTAEVTQAATDATLMRRLFNDWRFVLQQVGSERALLQFEPDFWGYAQFTGKSPTQLAAAVASANPTDCASQPNTLQGLGRCVVAMVRRYAPNAKVALHASAWATQQDVLLNRDASFDVEGEARKLADWLLEAGGREADFVTLDASDRDAGYYQVRYGRDTGWDDTDAKLPNYAQAFRWARALSERMQKPNLWWQVPVGNAAQGNTSQHWKDNRVATFTARTADVARSHGLGVSFGAGEGEQTNPTTDGGFLYARVKALADAGGQPPCP